jgi:DNA helicase HerA-like ATPase
MGALQFIIEFLNEFPTMESFEVERENISYNLEDLYMALEFALMSEGMLSNNSLYEKANDLRVRLNSILNSEQRKYFEYNKEYIEKEQFVKSMFLTDNNEYAQILNMNFNYIDDRFAKVLTKIYMKLFFNFATSLNPRASFPIHTIIEEAHRYVQNDNDINVIGYNIFDRITKEGRKYGIILWFITQRPSELSTTCLSQCSNFLVFRLYYPDDLNIITSISTNISENDVEKIKSFRPGNALIFGSAFKIPLLTKLNLPDPMPASSNVDLEACWFDNKNSNL